MRELIPFYWIIITAFVCSAGAYIAGLRDGYYRGSKGRRI